MPMPWAPPVTKTRLSIRLQIKKGQRYYIYLYFHIVSTAAKREILIFSAGVELIESLTQSQPRFRTASAVLRRHGQLPHGNRQSAHPNIFCRFEAIHIPSEIVATIWQHRFFYYHKNRRRLAVRSGETNDWQPFDSSDCGIKSEKWQSAVRKQDSRKNEMPFNGAQSLERTNRCRLPNGSKAVGRSRGMERKSGKRRERVLPKRHRYLEEKV